MLDALSAQHAVALPLLVGVAAALAGLFAALLRGARAPGGVLGAAMLGGLLAGTFVGDTVLARVAPGLHEAAFLGGRAERLAFEDRAVGVEREVAALEAAGVTGVAVEEYAREAMREIGPLQDAFTEARARRAGWMNFALALAGVAALALSPLASWRPARRDGAERPGAWLAGGFASFLLASAFAYACLTVLTNAPLGQCAALAACVGVGSLAALPERARFLPAPERPSLLQAGAGAMLPALVLCMWILPDRRAGLLTLGVLGMSAAVVVAGWMRRIRAARRVARGAVVGLVLPGLVALAAARVDWLRVAESRTFWLALPVVAIACSDARWLGALLGTRSVARATAVVTGGVGVAQVSLLAIFDAGGPSLEPFLAAGLLGALLVECSAGLYRWGAAILGQRTTTRAVD